MARSEGHAHGPDIRVTVLVTAVLLILTDLGLAAWFPQGERLPAHFSADYLQRYIGDRAARADVVVLGDSVLWGYGVSAADSPVAQLERRLRGVRVANLTYEAETPLNEDVLLRVLLSRSLRPRAVLVELNSASFNAIARGSNDVTPALAELAAPPASSERIDRFIAQHWLLYGLRVDVHQALFGDADLASALYRKLHPVLDATRLAADQQYEGTYDLTPLTTRNEAYAHYEHVLRTLRRERIPAIVVLPPVNHTLVHEYVDDPAYAANLARASRLAIRLGASVLNLDALLGAPDFLDNMHETPDGGARLARAIAPHVERVLHVL